MNPGHFAPIFPGNAPFYKLCFTQRFCDPLTETLCRKKQALSSFYFQSYFCPLSRFFFFLCSFLGISCHCVCSGADQMMSGSETCQ